MHIVVQNTVKMEIVAEGIENKSMVERFASELVQGNAVRTFSGTSSDIFSEMEYVFLLQKALYYV